MTDEMRPKAAWVVRAGKYGERDQWVLAEGRAGTGWVDIPNLTSCNSRDDVAEVVAHARTGVPANTQANYVGQLWALRGRITPGDIMVLPLKTTSQIAIGMVTGGYEYLADEAPDRRHTIPVDWKITDLPRAAVKQDLLYTLGSALTVFAPTRNHAIKRLGALIETGTDPGAIPFGLSPTVPSLTPWTTKDEVDEPEFVVDIAEQARDQITTKIAEEFTGHDLSQLVTALLEAEGFVCTMSPPGPDHGIDIIAGRGLLGMNSPKVIVQVKSESNVGEPVVRDLLGTVHAQKADQGLLVAWGGLAGPARNFLKNQGFIIKAWTADDVVEALLRVYDRLPEEIHARLPLRRVWMLA